MKNNIGITVAAIGLLLSVSGPTLFEDNQFLKYIFLALGILLSIYGTYKADKERKLN